MGDRLARIGHAVVAMKQQRADAIAAAESRSAHIAEAKDAVIKAAKALRSLRRDIEHGLWPIGWQENQTKLENAFDEAVDALGEAENQ